MTENEERAHLIEVARTWLGTPYHSCACVKGAGVDCAMLLMGIFHEADLVPWYDPRPYPPDWHMHQDMERYLDAVMRFAGEVQGPPERTPKPADVVLFRFGRTYSHGGIVLEWPRMIHAWGPGPVTISDIARATIGKHGLARLPKRFFSLWPRPRQTLNSSREGRPHAGSVAELVGA